MAPLGVLAVFDIFCKIGVGGRVFRTRKVTSRKTYHRRYRWNARLPAATLFFEFRVTAVQFPVGLHVHQAHFGPGQQSADYLRPVQLPVCKARRRLGLLLLLLLAAAATVFPVLNVIHQTQHLIRLLFYVAALSGKRIPR